jgi:hypothetical protein
VAWCCGDIIASTGRQAAVRREQKKEKRRRRCGFAQKREVLTAFVPSTHMVHETTLMAVTEAPGLSLNTPFEFG